MLEISWGGLCKQSKKQGLEVVCCDEFQESFYDEFCEFMGREIDYAWQVIDQFYELLLECRQVSEHIICLPSCNLEMN